MLLKLLFADGDESGREVVSAHEEEEDADEVALRTIWNKTVEKRIDRSAIGAGVRVVRDPHERVGDAEARDAN